MNYEDNLDEVSTGRLGVDLKEARLVLTLRAALIISVVRNDVIYQDIGIVLNSSFLTLPKREVGCICTVLKDAYIKWWI